MPVLIHPEFWARRRLALPGGKPFELPTTSRSALEDAGFAIIEQRQPSFLYDRSVLITGEVDRVTGFEKGFPVHQAWRGQSWEPDPLILDDQALIAHVAGRGLVVLTGCGHAGIINICRYAQRLTGVGTLHAVIGGFHLAGPLFEPVIADTVSALEQLAPEVIVPAHCTGWKATHAIARRLPGAFIQNSVGTTFHLTAAAALRPREQLSFFSTRAAHEAQVIPPIASSTARTAPPRAAAGPAPVTVLIRASPHSLPGHVRPGPFGKKTSRPNGPRTAPGQRCAQLPASW
jgi:metal-dependent hydrolase (beta-lactamase superfamily II)